MARKLLLSNGEMHVGINHYGLVDDVYFPYVGQENHTASDSLKHRIGLWVDGHFSWLDDGSWYFRFSYHHLSLVGRTIVEHHQLGIRLEFDDCVDSSQAALLRNIHVINLGQQTRDIRLYLHQVFAIANSRDSDTAQYLPDAQAIMHYKGHRVFAASAWHSDQRPFDEYSVGLFGIEGRDGTYRDAEDGHLSANPVEHGQVDSVLGLHLSLASGESGRIHYWLAAGTSQREALKINQRLQKNGLLHYQLHTASYWRQWLEPGRQVADRLPDNQREAFLTSLLLVKASQDKRGAVIASTDSDMLNYARDSYAYCWPRDAAYCLWPLLRIGYRDELIRYFNFARRCLHDDGYLSHKYLADGSLGSSWHPYVHASGLIGPPIQTDETALTLFLFGQYMDRWSEDKLLRDYYPTFVAPMANFLAGYIDESTGLPKPSYDLWEETYLTSTYTTAVSYAGLQAAARLADQLGQTDDALRWQSTADDIKARASEQLWNQDNGYFRRGFLRRDKDISYDDTIDSASLFGAFMFGLFDTDDERLEVAVATLRQRLQPTGQGGIGRYEDDAYNRRDPRSLGNPWPVTSLWLAQYLYETDQTEAGRQLLDWVLSRQDEAGILAEQYDPENLQPVSVAPLTWSQAELLSCLLDSIEPKDVQHG